VREEAPYESCAFLGSLPVIVLAPKVLHGHHAHHQAPPVADSNIQEPRVPPAFIEVEQPMLEGLLHELKSNRACPQNPVIPQHNSFPNPPQRVCNHEFIPEGVVEHLGV
jgi:hypothetical protein